jgi:hypothetical protein
MIDLGGILQISGRIGCPSDLISGIAGSKNIIAQRKNIVYEDNKELRRKNSIFMSGFRGA